MSLLLLVAALLIFAIQAIRARTLITSALWLAGVSALTSVLLYLYGAHLVAVIELSVGAGLVTVLFVFAISIAGDDTGKARSVPPLTVIGALTLLFVLLLGWFIWPVSVAPSVSAVAEPALSVVLWETRGLDLMVQVVLIFSGVLGLLGLLAEVKAPLEGSMADEVAAGRDREMKTLESRILQPQDAQK